MAQGEGADKGALHRALFTSIDREVTAAELKHIKSRLLAMPQIGVRDIEQCQDMLDVVELMDRRGLISVGHYDKLDAILADLFLHHPRRIIKETVERMNACGPEPEVVAPVPNIETTPKVIEEIDPSLNLKTDDDCRNFLRDNYSQYNDWLEVKPDLVSILYEEKVVNRKLRDEILDSTTKSAEKITLVLNAIEKKGRDGFLKFCIALKRTEQTELLPEKLRRT